MFGGAFVTFNLWTGGGLLSGGDFLSAAVTDAAVTALGLIAALGDQPARVISLSLSEYVLLLLWEVGMLLVR